MRSAQRLVLQRVDAAVELITSPRVRASGRRGIDAIGAGDGDIADRGHGAPDVGDRFAGRARRGRARHRRPAVEKLDVCGQRDRDANQAVLCQVREIVCGRSVDAEIIGIDGAEEWIVNAGRDHLRKPSLRRRRRQLEVLGVHVAVGARPAIAPQAGEGSVVEVRLASTERAIGFGLIPMVAHSVVGVRLASTERAMIGFGPPSRQLSSAIGVNEGLRRAIVLATATCVERDAGEQDERRRQGDVAVAMGHFDP